MPSVIPDWVFSSTVRHRSELFSWGLFTTWMIVVSLLATHHEFWRDEVRALSLAVHSSSLTDLVRSLENEGHPMLWYLLLSTGYAATGSVMVLPVLSLLAAGVSVYLLVFISPFPRWIKILFIFSGLPLYEYSVMARNYGISMLLLFAFAAVYRSRTTHPLRLGLLLAALSNTNIHSLMLAWLLMGLWAWDSFLAERRPLLGRDGSHFFKALTLISAGTAVALYTVWPTENMIPSDTARYNAAHVLKAVQISVVAPAAQFGDIFPKPVPIKLRIALLLGAILGLIIRPRVFFIAYVALVALSVFFAVVYIGLYRHQGLFVIFLMTLYWIVLEGGGVADRHKALYRLFLGGLYGGMALLLTAMVVSGATKAYGDWISENSASKVLAQELLNSHQEFKDAILIGEPDFVLEAIPYYAKNPIYIGREKRFGDTVRFVRNVQLNLSMGELLCTAWRVHREQGKPVLIILGHRFLGSIDQFDAGASSRTVSYYYHRTFSWSREELAQWRKYTKFEHKFDRNVIGDEAYTVYSLVSTEAQSQPICQGEDRTPR